MGAYDLVYITIGTETVGARPTSWDAEDVTGSGVDVNGNEVNPTEWMTTCPACADLVNVLKPNIYIATDKTEYCVKCPTCETGKEFKKSQFAAASEPAERKPDAATFIDPIKKGLFDHSIDRDLLVTLDEELVKLF